MDVNEKDWKLFRKNLPDWQENYMEKLIKEYVDFLKGDGLASDKFWELEKKIKKDMTKNILKINIKLNKNRYLKK